MKVIVQGHTILSYSNLDMIEAAGRTCYKSEDRIGCTLNHKEGHTEGLGDNCGVCPHFSGAKLTSALIKSHHDAMLEHGQATVKFLTNRGVTHELVRHRHASFGHESSRYCGYGKGKFGEDLLFIQPVWEMTQEQEEEFYTSLLNAEKAYKALIFRGWKPEQAREVLPNAIKTEIVMTCNFREWRHVFNLRALGTTGRPHPQIKALMLPLLAEFKTRIPVIFDDLVVPNDNA